MLRRLAFNLCYNLSIFSPDLSVAFDLGKSHFEKQNLNNKKYLCGQIYLSFILFLDFVSQ